jgi:FkbM family methyltransferase
VLAPTPAEYTVQAQSLYLKALWRLHIRPKRVPLWAPRCNLNVERLAIASLYDEVFLRRQYESAKPLPAAPRIVDAGAHLGLASLFFLTRYPACRLTVIEANPRLAELIRINLAPWWSRLELVEAALSLSNGTVEFHVSRENLLNVTGAIVNRELQHQELSTFVVPSVDARELLREPVDLMKLDVEGHEYELLELPLFEPGHIHNMVIEFHDVERRREQFVRLIGKLVERGYHIASPENVALHEDAVAQLRGCPVLKLY